MERALKVIIRKLKEEEMLEQELYIEFVKPWGYKRAGELGIKYAEPCGCEGAGGTLVGGAYF